jgi:mono/diheme cytochrome c family protein
MVHALSKLCLAAAVLALPACGDIGNDRAAPEPPAPGEGDEPPAPVFADVNAIFEAKCTPCHAEGHRPLNFIGHEDVVKAHVPNFQDRLTTTDPDRQMPPTTRPQLTDDERAKILAYVASITPTEP